MVDIAHIQGYLQGRLAEQAPGLVDRLVEAYVPRLVKDINRIAAARAEAAGGGTLFFTAALSEDRRTIVLTPSDPVLFRRLEFGEFDEQGQLRAPPHSVIQGLRVMVRV